MDGYYDHALLQPDIADAGGHVAVYAEMLIQENKTLVSWILKRLQLTDVLRVDALCTIHTGEVAIVGQPYCPSHIVHIVKMKTTKHHPHELHLYSMESKWYRTHKLIFPDMISTQGKICPTELW